MRPRLVLIGQSTAWGKRELADLASIAITTRSQEANNRRCALPANVGATTAAEAGPSSVSSRSCFPNAACGVGKALSHFACTKNPFAASNLSSKNRVATGAVQPGEIAPPQ